MQNHKITGIQHISFDLWMTLIQSHPEFKKKRAELFCRFFSVKNLEAAEKAIRKVDLMANHINETSGGNIDSLELYMLVLQDVSSDWKSFKQEALQSFYAETGLLFKTYAPLPVDDSITGALQMITDSGITMNILSNTGFIKGRMLRHSLAQLGWSQYFLFTIFSDETGHSKPHNLMFETVWNRVGAIKSYAGKIEKKNILHFGDNPFADVGGAEKFGFSSALFVPGKRSFYRQIEQVLKTHGINKG